MKSFYHSAFGALMIGLLASCAEKPLDMDLNSKDAAGSGSLPRDAASPDAALIDAGDEMKECNPIDGSGCDNGNFCFYVGDPVGVQCRLQSDPPKEHGEECSRSLKNCRAGFHCVLFQGETGNATCRKICDRGSHEDCAGLTGNADGFECKKTIDAVRNLGVCSPVLPECLPYDDMCEMDEYCQYTGGKIKCVAEGTGVRNGACDTRRRCQRGSICVAVNNDPRCYEPCDPNNPSCTNSMHQCHQQSSLQGTPLLFGICAP